MVSAIQDVRYAIRQLRKSPGFAIMAIMTLAIGIGSCTAIFSLVNGVLLRPLPYPESDRLVSLSTMQRSAGTDSKATIANETSYPNFFDWRTQSKSFDSIASYSTGSVSLAGNSSVPPRRVIAVTVSSDYFKTLGVAPTIGRGFTRDEEQAGNRSAVITDDVWRSEFGGDGNVIGKTLQINEENYTIVGVFPKSFNEPGKTSDASVYTTIARDREGKNPSAIQRGWNQLQVIGRLKSGVTLEQAKAEMDSIQRGLAALYPDDDKNEPAVAMIPELQSAVGDVQTPLRILFCAVCSLLLIACANVAGLLLARSSSRRSEVAVRAALGASRMQLIRQLLIESITLSLMGGICGVALAAALVRIAAKVLPPDTPRLDQITVDVHVLLFALAVSVITGLAFGVLPAWRMSRLDPNTVLREGGRTATAGRKQHRLHSALVIAETSLGLVLLVAAGLLIRSFDRVLRVDPGFRPQHMLTFRIAMPQKRYSGKQRLRLVSQLLPRLEALPGVESATAGFPLPLSGGDINISFSIDGHPTSPGDEPSERVSLTGPKFFQTLGIPLKNGRLFDSGDDQDNAAPVVIVNEAFARKYFPSVDAVGQRMHSGLGDEDKPPMREIVGVVGNVRRLNLTENSAPEYYIPFSHAAITAPPFAMRVSGNPESYAKSIRQIVAEQDSSLPVYRVRTYTDDLSNSIAQQRFQTILLTVFAAIALLLSAIGLYAVLSCIVSQRAMELGLRMALGAQRGDVLRLILQRGLALAAFGLALGLLASAQLMRFLNGLLFGIRSLDALTYISMTLLLLGVSTIAGLVPAIRASRLNPNEALRQQ